MMPTLKAAEETPMITVYEANVTDMDGYKNQFLTALQPKIDTAPCPARRLGFVLPIPALFRGRPSCFERNEKPRRYPPRLGFAPLCLGNARCVAQVLA